MVGGCLTMKMRLLFKLLSVRFWFCVHKLFSAVKSFKVKLFVSPEVVPNEFNMIITQEGDVISSHGCCGSSCLFYSGVHIFPLKLRLVFIS